MGVKGSWSRVQDRERYGSTLDDIQANEKKRRDRLEHALAVTGGKIVKPKKGGRDAGVGC